MLDQQGSQLGRGETVADTARVLSRYVDAIMLRTTKEEKLLEMAAAATVPVINGLTNRTHPCQLMADVMTFEEHRGPIAGKRVAWCGDGNNMATSWIQAAVQFRLRAASRLPRARCAPPPAVARLGPQGQGARITVTDRCGRPRCAARTAWSPTSGSPWATSPSATLHHNLLASYRVDEKVMAMAKPDAIFMHCLPAHRGEEVTADVIDGPQSAVWDEAENRLHAQKGILAWCLGVI